MNKTSNREVLGCLKKGEVFTFGDAVFAVAYHKYRKVNEDYMVACYIAGTSKIVHISNCALVDIPLQYDKPQSNWIGILGPLFLIYGLMVVVYCFGGMDKSYQTSTWGPYHEVYAPFWKTYHPGDIVNIEGGFQIVDHSTGIKVTLISDGKY